MIFCEMFSWQGIYQDNVTGGDIRLKGYCAIAVTRALLYPDFPVVTMQYMHVYTCWRIGSNQRAGVASRMAGGEIPSTLYGEKCHVSWRHTVLSRLHRGVDLSAGASQISRQIFIRRKAAICNRLKIHQQHILRN